MGQEPRQVVCAWGLVVVVGADGSVTCLREKPLAAKLALLHAKSLYLVALNLAQSEQARLLSRKRTLYSWQDQMYELLHTESLYLVALNLVRMGTE